MAKGTIYYDCFDKDGEWLSTVEATSPEDAKALATRILKLDPFYDGIEITEVWPNTRGLGYYPRAD